MGLGLTGTGSILGAAILAARDAATAAFMADKSGRALTPAEVATLRSNIATAEANALILHIVANAKVGVLFVGGVTIGTGISGPGDGEIL